ncbi:MAG: MBL fold metallo-hydrolase [Proteobacteria bacterium]|nr:MBL fold metallo-hydrolase [Pseudomonadota bacterium]
MHVRFWGTRGSLPKPGPDTLRFGGNTSCVEVGTAAGTLIVIDGGTGLHALGQEIVKVGKPRNGHLLISHTHWDHIQGIPFFAPFFMADSHWHIFAPKGFGSTIEETLAGQMQYAYFPVRLDQMRARITFTELVEGEFEIADVRIRTQYLNHTALTLGFRLEADGAALVYASDHEPYAAGLAGGNEPLTGKDLAHAEFAKDADLLIHDGQFTADEYDCRIGWGHSPLPYAAAVARTAHVTRLALTHHDPLRTDAELVRLVGQQRLSEPQGSTVKDIFAAAEGEVIELG